MSNNKSFSKPFRVNKHGFAITFPNGITLSTQFGYGAYSEHHSKPKYFFETDILDAELVEVAVIDKEGKFITEKAMKEIFNEDIGDNVAGMITIEEWMKIIKWCMGAK